MDSRGMEWKQKHDFVKSVNATGASTARMESRRRRKEIDVHPMCGLVPSNYSAAVAPVHCHSSCVHAVNDVNKDLSAT